MTQRVTQPRVPYRDRQQRIGERLRSVAEVEPSGELLARVTRLTGARPVGWVSRPGGFTPTERWSLDLADGRWVFAKRATRDWLAEALRIEHRNLGLIDADFRCAILGWEDGEYPLLLLEDLREARWPPPWQAGDVDRVLATLERVWAMPADDLPPAEEVRTIMSGWHQVAEDPTAFLRLGIASPQWVDRCVEDLCAAADAASYSGSAFLHMDVRSDNMCFLGERIVLVDWNWAVRGPTDLDLACWLPSLRLEGGPLPDSVAPGLGAYAAAIASYFAVNAALPPVPDSPSLRRAQRDQLNIALSWACRELGLPQPQR
jgi:hypothetical protein